MTPPAHFLAVLGIVLFFGLLLPQLFRPLHLPFATSLIVIGSLLGPNGLGYVKPDEYLMLFGFLGAMFQMLLAGTETRALGAAVPRRDIVKLVLLNGVLPAAVGIAIARIFAYGWTSSLFLGIVFFSSSIMLVFSMIESVGLGGSRVGALANRSAAVHDIGASVFAFVLFQTLRPHHRFPLPILAGLLLSSVIVLRMFLPEIVAFLFRRFSEGGDKHQGRLRLIISLFLLVIFGFSTLDVNPVIAAFLVGFVLAEIPESTQINERLESLGYGLFIPVFLFSVGMETNFRALLHFNPSNSLALTILIGAIGSKVLFGFIGGKWTGLGSRDAGVIAVSSTTKLAVPLSATYAARSLGIIDARLFSAIVVVAVVTSIGAPLVLSRLGHGGDARDAGTH